MPIRENEKTSRDEYVISTTIPVKSQTMDTMNTHSKITFSTILVLHNTHGTHEKIAIDNIFGCMIKPDKIKAFFY